MCLWFLWFPSLYLSSLHSSPSECAWGWAVQTYVLEMNKWKALPKEKSISWLETLLLFLVRIIATAVCICVCLCARAIKRETGWDKKQYENTVSVKRMCVLSQLQRCCLNVRLVFMCLFDSVFRLRLRRSFTSLNANPRHTQLLWIRRSRHTCMHTVHTETHKYTHDACFGEHVEWMRAI